MEIHKLPIRIWYIHVPSKAILVAARTSSGESRGSVPESDEYEKNRNYALMKSTKHRQGSNLNTFTTLVLIISIRQRIFCRLLASCKMKSDENFVEKGYLENRY